MTQGRLRPGTAQNGGDTPVSTRTIGLWILAVAAVIFSVRPADSQSRQSSDRRVLVSHEFTTSAEQWRISTDTGLMDPIFVPARGSAGGYITGIDEALGETWYFRAPDSVLEQLPVAENATIRFTIKQSTDIDGAFLDDDVVVVGRAGRIGYRFGMGSAPGTAWKEFAVRLSATEDWRWNWGVRATQAQIKSILAAPLVLEIRGEFVTGDDEGSLDRFSLTTGGSDGR